VKSSRVVQLCNEVAMDVIVVTESL